MNVCPGVSRCVSRRGYLAEAFEVEDQDVWERPEAELDAPLLQLLTVRTPPRIVRSQLVTMETHSIA